MTPTDFRHHDESRMLAGLPAYEPDLQCRERIRSRCHAAILAGRKKAETRLVEDHARVWHHAFELTAVATVCAGFLVEVARRAITLYGL